MDTAGNLHVQLFSHELRHGGARSGTGVAVVRDTDVIHLHLTPQLAGGCSGLPLEWRFLKNLQDRPLFGSQERSATGADHVVLWIDDSGESIHASCLVTTGSTSVECSVEIVETGPNTFTRNAPIIESKALSGCLVLCIGLGSGGSAVVDQLARSGVGRFVLWDQDRLHANNVVRHICTLRDIGRKKVQAVRDHVLSINPAAEVQTVNQDVMKVDTDVLDEVVKESDCVVAGTDNNRSRFRINEAALKAGKPIYFGRAYTRACGGDVIQVIPDEHTPCYACHVKGRVVDEEVSSTRDAGRISYADRPVPIEPGLSVDIQPIANMIARLVVLRLSGRTSSLRGTSKELDAPVYVWSNRREQPFGSWKPMGRSYSRPSILRWYAVNAKKDPQCGTCGTSSST